MYPVSRCTRAARFVLSIALLLSAFSLAQGKERIIYSFTKDNGYPYFDQVMLDPAGNIYVATEIGGGSPNCQYGCGTVFELMPSPDGSWTYKLLHSFNGADGSRPTGLTMDSEGNIYGAAGGGGTGANCNSGCGVIFELTSNPDGSWSETLLYSFQANGDGTTPLSVTFDSKGNLFGTMAEGYGGVFELSPPATPSGSWTETVLHMFGAFEGDGEMVNPEIAIDAAGNVYGTTFHGGLSDCSQGCGTVFRLKQVNGQWKEMLYRFKGGGNGYGPRAGVVLDSSGAIYGTLRYGGNRGGIVFRLRRVNGVWKERILYNFCSRDYCADGAGPNQITFDQAGNLYGSSQGGGTYSNGVAFKLTPAQPTWKLTVLHPFGNHANDGIQPVGNVGLDSRGDVYGITLFGGSENEGTIFQITP